MRGEIGLIAQLSDSDSGHFGLGLRPLAESVPAPHRATPARRARRADPGSATGTSSFAELDACTSSTESQSVPHSPDRSARYTTGTTVSGASLTEFSARERPVV